MYNVLCFQSYKTNVSIHEKHKAKQNKNTHIAFKQNRFFRKKTNNLTKPLFSHMVHTSIHDGIMINFLVDF